MRSFELAIPAEGLEPPRALPTTFSASRVFQFHHAGVNAEPAGLHINRLERCGTMNGVTTHPGVASRARPPPAHRPRLVPRAAYCVTCASHRLSKSCPSNADRPTRLGAQVGRSTRPGGAGWTNAARSAPPTPTSAPRFVFASFRSKPRLEVTTSSRSCRAVNLASVMPSIRPRAAGHTPGFSAKAEVFLRASRNPGEPVMDGRSPFGRRGATPSLETQKSRPVVWREAPVGLFDHLRDATPGEAR